MALFIQCFISSVSKFLFLSSHFYFCCSGGLNRLLPLPHNDCLTLDCAVVPSIWHFLLFVYLLVLFGAKRDAVLLLIGLDVWAA